VNDGLHTVQATVDERAVYPPGKGPVGSGRTEGLGAPLGVPGVQLGGLRVGSVQDATEAGGRVPLLNQQYSPRG
jgi:hypothetical protein